MNKSLQLVNPTQLQGLYLYYTGITSDSDLKHLRFGQFIFNLTNIEINNSYNEKDSEKVYNMLLNHLKKNS